MTQTIKVQDIVLNNLKSHDGKPLDFSFKNIKNLNELKYIEPRSGKRKPLLIIQEENQQDNKEVKDQSLQQEEKETVQEKDEKQEEDQENLEEKENEQNEDEKNNEKEKIEQSKKVNFIYKKGPQIQRLIPQNNIHQLIAQYNIPLNTCVQSKPGVQIYIFQNNANKNFEEIKIIQQKKIVKVQLICSTLILSYNQIRSLESANFYQILNQVMPECRNLTWIDLSHNYLTDLNYDFIDFPQLKSIYLHSNYIADFSVLKKLKCPNLINLTIHGNPIETIPNFRLIVISQINTLKKLDTVLVSKKELDNANFLITNQKGYKYPEVKNPLQPPEIQVQQDQKNKN